MPIEDRGAPHSLRRALVVNAAELLREPGSTRHVASTLELDELDLHDDRFRGTVDVDVDLTSTLDRVLAVGRFGVRFVTTCARCLTPIDEQLAVEAHEMFAEDPPDEELFPIEHGQLDLAPFAREAILLALPEAPVCREDCAGLCPTCGADLNADPEHVHSGPVDERWAVLDQLRTDEPR